ncbi:MAG: hypothetical protein GIW95_11835 [Candidatus Eremiobacteraeota bacterium]|nr:hypothetical protein [Candidatus Eremiobacteraeota bacterium]
MKRSFVVAFVAVMAFGALAAPGHGASTALTTGMLPMQFFLGNWTCSGSMTGKPKRAAKVVFEGDIRGTMIEEQVEAPAAGAAKAYGAAAHYAYDAKKHRIVESYLNEFGAYGAAWTPGWKGSVMTFTDVTNSDGSLGRATFTKLSETSWTETDYETSKGKKHAVFSATCTKAATP